MNCKNCKHELTAVAEMDEYELCHHCYCTAMELLTTINKQEREAMTKETIRAEIIRGFEDLRFLLTEGVSKGELQPMQTIGMLEQLNQAQWLIEQGMKERETAQ
jgi:hypothetical protein